jgi:outer membrane autotransporter protein
MKKKVGHSLLVLLLGIGSTSFGYSNPIDGGTAEVVTNTYQVPLPWYVVGGNDAGNSLVITDGGQVNNLIGYIGRTVSSSNNSALVTGSGATWNSSMELSVGRDGLGNTLTVANSGEVDTAIGYIGYNSANNILKVEDAGSLVDATTLYVGHIGDDNDLIVDGGGRVESAMASIGYWISSDSNHATVQGTNSLWRNSGTLNVGDYGSGNQLAIEVGGRVESGVINLGVQSISSNNIISVSGNGALLDAPELNIGGTATTTGGTGNRVEVQNGGTVATTDLTIYAGNRLDLNNGGTFSINNDFNASMIGFNFNSGGTLEVGGELTGMDAEIEDQRTVIMNGSNAVWNLGVLNLDVGYNTSGNKLVVTNGGQVIANDVLAGFGTSSSGNRIIVTGEGSKLTTPGGGVGVAVGHYGSDNHMVVEDGASVETKGSYGHGILGYYSSSLSNTMLVDDASVDLSKNLYVGLYGAGNQLSITNGGIVRAGGGTAVGRHAGSDGNIAVVSGEESLLETGASLSVGAVGSDNVFVVSDGGEARTDLAYIGANAASSGNSATVTGFDSKWIVANELYVGRNGSGNALSVENGGRVESESGYIGYGSSSTGNSALVSGRGSVWHNRESLYLGGYTSGNDWVDGGTGNSLTVSNGGWVLVGDVDTNNLRQIHSRGGIAVGDASGMAEMVIANGSVVTSGGSAIGLGAEETGSVLVTGQGTEWNLTGFFHSFPPRLGALYVGRYGSNNQLLISDGARVESGESWVNPSVIGYSTGSTNNRVVVSGAGSVWDMGQVYSLPPIPSEPIIPSPSLAEVIKITQPYSVLGEFSVGFSGTANSLIIEDGGMVRSQRSSVGRNATASDNSVVVSGEDSVWLNQEALYLGGHKWRDKWGYNWAAGGTGNSLTVSNGGWVLVGNVDTNNIPEWGSGGFLVVGDSGGASEMVVANGSEVDSNYGFIGLGSGESGSVVVSGKDTEWNNSSQLRVGYAGSGNVLHIENGGHAHARGGASIGHEEGADNNSVVVSGEDSVLSSGWYWHPIVFEPPFVIYPSPTNFYPIYGGGGSVWSGGSVVSGSYGSGNTLTVGNGGGTGDSISVLTNGVAVSDGSGVFFGSTNVVIGGGDFFGGAGDVAVISEPIVITNDLPLIPVEPVMIMVSWGELSVGRGGSGNALMVEDGAEVSNVTGILGERSTASNNFVSVTGTHSEWRNSEDLYIGGRMSQYYYLNSDSEWENEWLDGGRSNSLHVSDGGLVSVGRDMHNRNHSTVTLDLGGQIQVASNYYQDATSALRFEVELDEFAAPTNAFVSVGGTAEFEHGAQVQYHYDADMGWLDFDTFHTNLLVEADQLIVGGVTNANALDLKVVKLDGSLVNLMLMENEQDIYGIIGRRYLAESAGFESGSMMARIAGEIDDLSLLGHAGAARQINQLNRMSSEEQAAQLRQRFEQGVPTYMHGQAIHGGRKQVLAQSRRFQAGGTMPEGAAGPHEEGQGLRGWMRGYGSWADRDTDSTFSGYDQNVYGTVVGIDRSFGNLLLGVAGGYARSDIDQDNRDSSDAQTGYGMLYASVGTADWFGDLNLSYGRSDVETRSGTVFDASGDFNADSFGLYVGGGKEIRFSRNRFMVTPEAAFIVGWYDQESYSESSSFTAMEVDAYDRWSYQTRLGAALGMEYLSGSVLIKPEVRGYWLHEFEDDPERIGYSLVGGTGRYVFSVQSPDEDVFEVGAGLSATFRERLELVFDVDGQFADAYEAVTVGARAMYQF